MSVRIVTGQALERSGVVLMARILGAGGTRITQASVSTLKYEVGYVDTPPELRGPLDSLTQATPVRTSDAAQSLTVEDVVYDALQTGPTWAVVAAAPATVSHSTLYVDPLRGLLPAGKTLDFKTGSATLLEPAYAGSRSLPVAVVGTIGLGAKAIAGTPQVPAATPWKIDDIGYNFRLNLAADDLAEIPIDQYPDPRYYVVSVELTPVAGEVFGWEYRLETFHRLFEKWEPDDP